MIKVYNGVSIIYFLVQLKWLELDVKAVLNNPKHKMCRIFTSSCLENIKEVVAVNQNLICLLHRISQIELIITTIFSLLLMKIQQAQC